MENTKDLLHGNIKRELIARKCAFRFCRPESWFWKQRQGKERIPVIGSVLQITIRVALSYLWIGVMGLKAVALATGIGWMAIVVYQILTYRCLKRRSNSR